jgi:hypothetical protein
MAYPMFCAGYTVLTTTMLTATAESWELGRAKSTAATYGNDAAVLTVIRYGSEPQIAAQRVHDCSFYNV